MTTVPVGRDRDGADSWSEVRRLDVRRVAEWDSELISTDPLRFPGYRPTAPGQDSVWTGLGQVGRQPVALVVCRFENVGGTMGAVAGERLVRAFARATEMSLPVVELVSSGGARLQEGMYALVQMARTATAVREHRRAGLLSVAVLRSPTTGGVYASWVSLADLRAAAPKAVIGFGGPRVVAEVTGTLPPDSSHTAESAYAAGLIDAVVDDEASWIAAALGETDLPADVPRIDVRAAFPAPIPVEPWQVLMRARGASRPSGWEWAAWLTDSWVELQGRDRTVRAGLTRIGGRRAVVIAMDRHARPAGSGRTTPDGFRLARRAIGLADRLDLPVITVIDTPGAEPGPDAEAGGVAREIAETLHAMAACSSPTVALCVGEGGSGGAMALAHADRVVMLSGSVFSVIGPEPGAVVLYRDRSRAAGLTAAFRMAAPDLAGGGFADEVVDELSGSVVADVRRAVLTALAQAVPGDRDRRIDAMTERALQAQTDVAGA